jgi:hypothetical protein
MAVPAAGVAVLTSVGPSDDDEPVEQALQMVSHPARNFPQLHFLLAAGAAFGASAASWLTLRCPCSFQRSASILRAGACGTLNSECYWDPIAGNERNVPLVGRPLPSCMPHILDRPTSTTCHTRCGSDRW